MKMAAKAVILNIAASINVQSSWATNELSGKY